MTTPYTLLAIASIAIASIALPLSAQHAGDPDLYIPPMIDVRVSLNPEVPMGILFGAPSDSLGLKKAFVIGKRSEHVTDPILPIIFFDPASSTIPERYAAFTRAAQADDYTEHDEVLSAEMREDDLAKYHEVLNVIGFRLRRYSDARITLEGCYSTEPGESAAIGRERALVVKEYLEGIWKIAPERITLLPPRRACDSSDHLFRQEEARRVVIEADGWPVHRPVEYTKARLTHSLVSLLMIIDPKADPAQVAGIMVTMASGDDVLGATALPTSPDSAVYRALYFWILPRRVEDLGKGVTFQATVSMIDGSRRVSAPLTLPVTITTESDEFDYSRYAEGYYRAYEETHREDVEEYGGDDDVDELVDTSAAVAESGEEWVTTQEEPMTEEEMAIESEADREALVDAIETLEAVEESFADVEEEISDLPLPERPEDLMTTVSFIPATDTSLGRVQRMMVERCIATALYNSGRRRGDYYIGVSAHGEQGDNPDIDRVGIAVSAVEERNRRMSAANLFSDHSFQASLVPVPTMEEIMEGGEEFSRRFNQAMFGDRAESIEETTRGYNGYADNRIEYAEGTRRAIDTILSQRGERIAAYIRSTCDDVLCDSVEVRSSWGYVNLPTKFLPEERYYERRVDIRIHTKEKRGLYGRSRLGDDEVWEEEIEPE